MSCIVFKLPSSVAVVGVPLQFFLLAVCWQNNSCYCFIRIDFHRTAPSKAYLQATTLQQNINAVSFSAFLRRKKKKHFQQSSTWDAIYSGHIEDKMLIFKGLNFSSISPSPTNREKKSCPQVSLCTAQHLKIGVCVFYQGLYRKATFCRSGKVGELCSHVPSEVGRFRKGAQVCHVLPSNIPIISFKSPPWSASVKGQGGSHGQGYVGAFILCKSAAAQTVYFHSHLPSMAFFLHCPCHQHQLRHLWHLIWLKTKSIRKDYFGPEEHPASLYFRKRRQLV